MIAGKFLAVKWYGPVHVFCYTNFTALSPTGTALNISMIMSLGLHKMPSKNSMNMIQEQYIVRAHEIS